MPGAVLPPNPKLAAVPDVVIDENSRFKYILCSVADSEKTDEKKTIVRGSARHEFHADIYDALDSMLEEQGLTCQCLGGGKIKHDTNSKTIEVFGKSQGYGRANHSLTVDILRQKYPEYGIKWSDD